MLIYSYDSFKLVRHQPLRRFVSPYQPLLIDEQGVIFGRELVDIVFELSEPVERRAALQLPLQHRQLELQRRLGTAAAVSRSGALIGGSSSPTAAQTGLGEKPPELRTDWRVPPDNDTVRLSRAAYQSQLSATYP